MFLVLLQMSLLIACGTLWRYMAPKHISPLAHRRALTDLVFYILLPALVLDVIWGTPLNSDAISISLVAISALITATILIWLALRWLNVSKSQKGALILAAVFPNVTYLGLPVTDQTLGTWSNAIVLQYDLFACTPLVMTFGVLLAQHYGNSGKQTNPLIALSKVPPLWAIIFAIVLNKVGVERSDIIHEALTTLSGGVVPLMLIVLGMSIRWDALSLKHLPLILPVAIISLLIAPISAYFVATSMHLDQQTTQAVVVLAAMPTMIFGVVICDRYQLDSNLYAASVTFTTLASLLTLPFWFHLVSS